MKTTVSINLGGYSFYIDEDAYTVLKDYLRNLEIHLAGEESSAEILADIEARMAELFREKLRAYKQVITLQDTREVISVMGHPEDLTGDGDNNSREKFAGRPRRMYRDTDNRVIGGVCAGIGAYWSIDSWLVRILFIVFTMAGGVGIIIYLILYIVLPEARTTAQKIEMKGEPVNINNIKEAVRKEFNTVRRHMKL